MATYMIEHGVHRNSYYEFDFVNTSNKERRSIRVSQNATEQEVNAYLDQIKVETEAAVDVVGLVAKKVESLNRANGQR